MRGADAIDTASVFAFVGACQASPALGFVAGAILGGVALVRRSPSLQDALLGEHVPDSRLTRYFFKAPARELPAPKVQPIESPAALIAPRQPIYPTPIQRGDTQPIRATTQRPVVQLTEDEDIDTGGLESITLDELASADTLLIVGNRGSGKSTLLKAILRARRDAIIVYDPHGPADEWPDGCEVVGPGREWAGIYRHIVGVHREMDKRSKQLARKEVRSGHFARFTVAADEWGSITTECPVDGKDEAPAVIMRRVLKEGRKFDISFITGAHGDTAASLGSSGDTVAFQQSFDWIIYCGGFVRRKLPPETAHIVKSFPIGRTPQGGTFPLIAVAISPTTGDMRLLDMRGLSVAPAQPSIVQSYIAPVNPIAPADPWDAWTAQLYASAPATEPDSYQAVATMVRRGKTSKGMTLALVSGDEAEAFRALHAAGMSVNEIAALWRGKRETALRSIGIALGTREPLEEG